MDEATDFTDSNCGAYININAELCAQLLMSVRSGGWWYVIQQPKEFFQV